MKLRLTLLLVFASLIGHARTENTAQPDTAAPVQKHATYERHTLVATLSAGLFDDYRRNYSMPAGFEKNNTSGFAPFYGKLEYGFYRHISIAVAFGYDAFTYNYKQDYTGNNGAFTRYRLDNARIISAGIEGFYHLGETIYIRHLDPFIDIGLSISNIRYSAYPKGDTTATKFDHSVNPCAKIGARYYISSAFALFGDLGYDKQSMLNLGFSCRFLPKKKNG